MFRNIGKIDWFFILSKVLKRIYVFFVFWKMYSFITLMNENQLNKSEQKQVYNNIRNEYKNLLKNYDEVKRNDSSGVIQDELELDM